MTKPKISKTWDEAVAKKPWVIHIVTERFNRQMRVGNDKYAGLVEYALRRLTAECIDAFLAGEPWPPRLPANVVQGSIAETLRDMEDMAAGKGKHADHTQRQVGRCVYCSCGARAQGRITK